MGKRKHVFFVKKSWPLFRRVTHTYIALFGIIFDCESVDFNVIGLFLFSYFCCMTSPTPDNVTDKAMFVTRRCFWKNFDINSIFYYLMHFLL